LDRDTPELWPGQKGVIRKINSLRQFNELSTRERLGNDGILMVDDEGRITYASGKSQALLGYAPEELLGRPLSDFLTPESLGSVQELLPSQRSRDPRKKYEMVFVDRAEARVPAMVTSTDLFRRGELAGSLLVVADLRNRDELVEDLKGIQNRLRHSSVELNKKLWELFVVKEVAHTLQTTLSLDEVLRTILTGVTAEQGLGFNRAFLVLLDQKANCLRGKLAVGPSSPQEAERIWNGLRDQSFTLKELLERHRDASGQFDPGLNEIVKRMEFDLVPEGGIITRSVLEGKNFNVTEASKNPLVDAQLLELLGTEAFVVVPLIARGRPLGAVIADNRFTGRPIEQADVELMETLTNYASFAIERAHLYEQLTNKVHELERACADLKESQDQLLRAERLSVVGKMATRLTHEMRNPIVSLGGFVHRVSKNLPADDPNQEYMGIITEEVARLEKLLTEVLDFARPAKPSLEMVDLNEVIQKVMATMQPEIAGKRVAAQADLQPDLPSMHLDPLQMSQVMMNLIRNGLEAMSSGGKLFIRTRSQGDQVKVEIEDTGVGIPQEHLDKLFSEFFTTKSAGVGLGLAVAYQTVHNHGGSIGVRSREGKGSTFFIDLPVEQQEEQH
jgi:PAS domain S-box-containing protein